MGANPNPAAHAATLLQGGTQSGLMSILPGLDFFNRSQDYHDSLAGMIGDLIEQANTNYLRYLAAAATHNIEQAWDCYSESLALEEDIATLSRLHGLVSQSAKRDHPL